MEERKCILCGKLKPLSEFYSHKGNSLGKDYSCKDCDKVARVAKSMKNRGIDKLKKEIAQDEIVLSLKRIILKQLEEGNKWNLKEAVAQLL